MFYLAWLDSGVLGISFLASNHNCLTHSIVDSPTVESLQLWVGVFLYNFLLPSKSVVSIGDGYAFEMFGLWVGVGFL